ncbi:Nuclear receptor coactivator 7 [Heterocephalus glaber]|uniref:Nuclear receptor coactivator 7 n=1 Tax=Heterocephalus glaber TaxID=10181 RepID=G5AYB6_HETGA|nr:Nuclear receptor coactivator 7 [Heterocephalus glaber]
MVKFQKMNCRYFTNGKCIVKGIMIVTPNNIMFDPHKSDPLVIENGCEEYGLIYPLEEVVSIELYDDISHMKIEDTLPLPGEWADLGSERDLSPFTKEKCLEGEDDDFVDLEELSSHIESGVEKSNTSKERLSVGPEELQTDSSTAEVSAQAMERNAGLKGTLDSEAALDVEVDKQSGDVSADSPEEPDEALEEETEPLALEPTTKSWEIISFQVAKSRRSTCSYEDEDEEGLPVLQPHSVLLENMHIEQLARCLPERVQGYPWRLA